MRNLHIRSTRDSSGLLGWIVVRRPDFESYFWEGGRSFFQERFFRSFKCLREERESVSVNDVVCPCGVDFSGIGKAANRRVERAIGKIHVLCSFYEYLVASVGGQISFEVCLVPDGELHIALLF